MTITVFHINNKWFLPVADGMRELSSAVVNTWRDDGVNIEVKEAELYV
ncbi:hypothetical protein [Mesobacillus stamsii]|uniref:Uncharacterized protein n=1 Tax=Mesobacillus stamsii TaxID=225347 RepID=A0ABU0FW98_9BACI|nr:hypothetical protein [Mesobacillus stamsii]MDQ0414194.1 hypothetical protein [Mesobacillus stamsii]